MLVILVPLVLFTIQSVTDKFGGGGIASNESGCISLTERKRIQSIVEEFHARKGQSDITANSKYQVYPIGGLIGTDIFPNNYVDLDTTSGLRDWDCTTYTYNGHLGIDFDLRGFVEQEIGVPVFAPKDGTVVEVDDGNFDHNVYGDIQPGNHVILYHGGNQYSLYWHFRRGTIRVQAGDQVKSGEELGQVGSSGSSTGPHLHFESWAGPGSQFAYDPHSGGCNPGSSGFVAQQPVPRQFGVRKFALSMVDFSRFPGPPYEMPNAANYVIGSGPVGFYIQAINLPVNSNFRVRFLRPNGTVAFDSGTGTFGSNPFYRQSWWWWRYTVNLNTAGAWTAELSVNGVAQVTAPFNVGNAYPLNSNLPPYKPSVAIIPPVEAGAPLAVQVVAPDIVTDPDYDVVRYRYVWRNGRTILRDVTHAGRLDMVPAKLPWKSQGWTVTVTPFDGMAWGQSTTVVWSNEAR